MWPAKRILRAVIGVWVCFALFGLVLWLAKWAGSDPSGAKDASVFAFYAGAYGVAAILLIYWIFFPWLVIKKFNELLSEVRELKDRIP